MTMDPLNEDFENFHPSFVSSPTKEEASFTRKSSDSDVTITGSVSRTMVSSPHSSTTSGLNLPALPMLPPRTSPRPIRGRSYETREVGAAAASLDSLVANLERLNLSGSSTSSELQVIDRFHRLDLPQPSVRLSSSHSPGSYVSPTHQSPPNYRQLCFPLPPPSPRGSFPCSGRAGATARAYPLSMNQPPPAMPNYTPRRECSFCKNNGEPEAMYKSHSLRDPKSRGLICPVLRSHQCEICGKTGDDAHTKNYCPEITIAERMQRALPRVLKETRRQSDGQLRK